MRFISIFNEATSNENMVLALPHFSFLVPADCIMFVYQTAESTSSMICSWSETSPKSSGSGAVKSSMKNEPVSSRGPYTPCLRFVNLFDIQVYKEKSLVLIFRKFVHLQMNVWMILRLPRRIIDWKCKEGTLKSCYYQVYFVAYRKNISSYAAFYVRKNLRIVCTECVSQI